MLQQGKRLGCQRRPPTTRWERLCKTDFTRLLCIQQRSCGDSTSAETEGDAGLVRLLALLPACSLCAVSPAAAPWGRAETCNHAEADPGGRAVFQKPGVWSARRHPFMEEGPRKLFLKKNVVD